MDNALIKKIIIAIVVAIVLLAEIFFGIKINQFDIDFKEIDSKITNVEEVIMPEFNVMKDRLMYLESQITD